MERGAGLRHGVGLVSLRPGCAADRTDGTYVVLAWRWGGFGAHGVGRRFFVPGRCIRQPFVLRDRPNFAIVTAN